MIVATSCQHTGTHTSLSQTFDADGNILSETFSYDANANSTMGSRVEKANGEHSYVWGPDGGSLSGNGSAQGIQAGTVDMEQIAPLLGMGLQFLQWFATKQGSAKSDYDSVIAMPDGRRFILEGIGGE